MVKDQGQLTLSDKIAPSEHGVGRADDGVVGREAPLASELQGNDNEHDNRNSSNNDENNNDANNNNSYTSSNKVHK